jgi:hypothetical protein
LIAICDATGPRAISEPVAKLRVNRRGRETSDDQRQHQQIGHFIPIRSWLVHQDPNLSAWFKINLEYQRNFAFGGCRLMLRPRDLGPPLSNRA